MARVLGILFAEFNELDGRAKVSYGRMNMKGFGTVEFLMMDDDDDVFLKLPGLPERGMLCGCCGILTSLGS